MAEGRIVNVRVVFPVTWDKTDVPWAEVGVVLAEFLLHTFLICNAVRLAGNIYDDPAFESLSTAVGIIYGFLGVMALRDPKKVRYSGRVFFWGMVAIIVLHSVLRSPPTPPWPNLQPANYQVSVV